MCLDAFEFDLEVGGFILGTWLGILGGGSFLSTVLPGVDQLQPCFEEVAEVFLGGFPVFVVGLGQLPESLDCSRTDRAIIRRNNITRASRFLGRDGNAGTRAGWVDNNGRGDSRLGYNRLRYNRLRDMGNFPGIARSSRWDGCLTRIGL